MEAALTEAQAAAFRDEVPVGAVVVSPTGEIVSRAGNRTRERYDPTAHAEVLAIRDACAQLQMERLVGHDLYVTLEPCAMCASVISFARIRRLYFGADDAKSGAVLHGPRIFNQPNCHHVPEWYDGMSADQSRELLRNFFKAKRR